MISKVCDAIDHAHRQGIVHRDLTPPNIMMTDDEEPKLVDFGLARSMFKTSEADSAVHQGIYRCSSLKPSCKVDHVQLLSCLNLPTTTSTKHGNNAKSGKHHRAGLWHKRRIVDEQIAGCAAG